jgi:tetratricopeptide (TPR) repeat protein
MPETAKILPFRAREHSATCTRKEASERAGLFLRTLRGERTKEFVDAALGDGDVMTSILSSLWGLMNTSPSVVADEAPSIYRWLSGRPERDFFFDERDFFLGESALLAAGSLRLVGERDETERWLDRADAGFRHTVAPAAHLARVSYIRLTLRYDTRRHEEVLELSPSVALTFQKLGMRNDLSKCRFLEAMSLKELGRIDEAAERLESLASAEEGQVESALCGMALVNLGNLRSEQGSFDLAIAAYRKASPLLQSANRPVALADLKLMLGGTLQRTGHLTAAIQAFRESVTELVAIGTETRVAYHRVVLAGALLEAGRAREAEWEILAALPTIDEQRMAPEGFAAVALLRESVRQRRTDLAALGQVRNYLQTSN